MKPAFHDQSFQKKQGARHAFLQTCRVRRAARANNRVWSWTMSLALSTGAG